MKELQPWKYELERTTKHVIGSTKIDLQISRCKYEECPLGNLITDSMVEAFKDHKDETGHPLTLAAFVNAGGIRVTLAKGDITYGDVLSCLPFGNPIEMIKISGQMLRSAFEWSVSNPDPDFLFKSFLQVSGLRVVFDIRQPVGQRVTKLKILLMRHGVPMYVNVRDDINYLVLTNFFLVEGGDGYWMLKKSSNHSR